MLKMIITSPAFAGELEFRYDNVGLLSYFENRAQMNPEQIQRLYGYFPLTRDGLDDLCKKSKTLTVAQIAVEITWEMFYDTYGYKVGNKARAIKLFKATTQTERVMIMEHLPKYEKYLSGKPHMEKLYPETYLNQRRWENELPK